MIPQDALIELINSLAASDDATVLITDAALNEWSAAAVKVMKKQRLITRSKPASSAVCPGCEHECVMPVHCVTGASNETDAFIVCDKRSDTNRVMTDSQRLTQWQCNAEAICRFVAESLQLRRSEQTSEQANRWYIGVATGNKRSQMLCLQIDDFCMLVAGSHALPLADFIDYHDGTFSLNNDRIRKLVDTAGTANNRYTPNNVKREARKFDTQAMYQDWQKAYRKLKKDKPNMSAVWYSQQIAKMEIAQGRDMETIRKNMIA